MTMQNGKPDVYQRVTDSIVRALEAGTRPWIRPWQSAHTEGRITRPLRFNMAPYSGVNVLMLWAAAMERGYESAVWMTYRQAQELSGQVRAGEKSAQVVYASEIVRSELSESTGETVDRAIPFLKVYSVFNVAQIDGLPERFKPAPLPPLAPVERDARAESFFAATGARVEHGGGRACYSPSADMIQLPIAEAFADMGAYYATRAHETTHWTRHESRLARGFGRKRFGDEGYAMEELVAELGAAFLCADLGLELSPREDHASYIANWLTVLKSDKRAIFTAAAHAEKAAAYLHAKQPGAVVPSAESAPESIAA